MDFSWSEAQLGLQQRLLDFARAELDDPALAERDAASAFSRDLWQKCAAAGIQGLPVPAAYGGSGLDLSSTALAMETLGYACRDHGLLFLLGAQLWSVAMPIATLGNEAQKAALLPRLCRGEILALHGMTEPESGSDAFALRTRARWDAARRGYVLDGTKTLITGAPVADVGLVYATVDPELGRWGVTAFVLDLRTRGVEASANLPKMGLRTAPMGRLAFRDCFVPESARLGEEGSGAAIFTHSMTWERGLLGAAQIGAMARQLEMCVEHARTRRQFGQPIGSFQAVACRIADMKLRLETARLLLYRTAWELDQGVDAELDAALTKLQVSESYLDSSLDAVRVFGGRGYLADDGVERQLRDAVGGTLYSGTSDIQKLTIARLCGL
jgi:hypothetical protein